MDLGGGGGGGWEADMWVESGKRVWWVGDCRTWDGSKSPVIPGHPSEVSSTSKNLEPKEVDEVSAQAFNAAEVTRVTTTQRTKDKELQESSLWDNLKGLASSIISFWRKT
ncbi:1 4-alpha-glucan branching enzyme GlgB [Bienertia sinuspersici]